MAPSGLHGKKLLLVIAGGIAAYKMLEFIRRGREAGLDIRTILTAGGAQFVTPLSVAALTENKVYQDLFSLTDESEMGHIRLVREADLILVAPASADLIAKMAHGLADDLASTALLAADKPVLIAPTMNVQMWANAATQANIATLRQRGIQLVGPGKGDLACGEVGSGRMAEPADILAAVGNLLGLRKAPLQGKRALVTSGPTYEPIDPVRYIANRSSGKQGHAIAAALARLGAETILVSGPTREPDPLGVTVHHIESAREMLGACEAALPVDIAVCAAAVADWRVADASDQKLKKDGSGSAPTLQLATNPDILAGLAAAGAKRPKLVIGFAAETEKLIEHAQGKLARKGCDWIIANDVSSGSGTFGGDSNLVHLITRSGAEAWPRMSKLEIADRLAQRIAETVSTTTHQAHRPGASE
ncbi:bifunctional phosphopantothenoylcysteine decarboxylase/phosphopantothenate--cysteine ligase CoaBC [Dongia soli]|uniref:Coenzyme A biosynthesis bifunctional protein CoaBC n=1 Tax=Dongia soli TaxID=600628 RepID=A0ABU5E6B5_9PROT|nr:bifunctional phosphopantothenoylcysteine decarboxylase/phosphopantothenate--cysteine ligase CoaBC [Dongia soli]MDY0881820.1 bifunctional phosphopantothenoylcysteine decarboxylase/phosphopantothenate--cysteine ligase CoaBC [Dongia soli]